MKVIDLLNKIANGEEVPKKIEFHGQHYLLTNGAYGDYKDYISTLAYNYLFDDEWNLTGNLNEEVEIIEEEKKIEKLNKMHFHKKQRQLANKINEIIDYINGSDK